MHRQPALRKFGCDCSGEYPVSDWLADNGFYLPSASSIKEDDIDSICGIINDFGRNGT